MYKIDLDALEIDLDAVEIKLDASLRIFDTNGFRHINEINKMVHTKSNIVTPRHMNQMDISIEGSISVSHFDGHQAISIKNSDLYFKQHTK